MDDRPKRGAMPLLLYFFAGMLLLCGLSFAFLVVSFRTRTAEYEENLLTNARFLAAFQRDSMTEVLNGVIADLLYLADEYATHSVRHESPDALAADFLMFCRRKKVYDQIRIIGINGMEKLRINYNRGTPSIVPASGLQDKSGRYYFQDAMRLSENTIYLSRVDLNVEHGVIEMPEKPMIRIATPVFLDGQKAGLLVLNFLADEFLDQSSLDGVSGRDVSSVVLNSTGDVLMWEAHPELEFLFMFPDEPQIRFRDRFPQESAALYRSDEGTVRTSNGLFVWQTVRPITDILTGETDVRFASTVRTVDNYYWKIVIMADEERIELALGDIRRRYLREFLVSLGPIFLVSAFAAWLVDKNRQYRRRIRRMAQYDELTDLPNRRLLTVLGEKQLALAQRQQSMVGVLFLDLDGFKPVNDTYGHAAGDMVLREMARRIPVALRSYDLVFRIGGDEFVVILQTLSSRSDAVGVAEKIVEAVNRPVELSGEQVQLGASIGVSIFPDDEKSLEVLIRLADEAMYRAKVGGRNRVVMHGSV